ncbi:hypothetical protein Nepgr_000847 [Nepenthes gracilis]|uniref:Uncharacterized protein n=1 Tax=Nepenthes gracilis TaxID=150966 RepID=A0AAD3P443_NEPGR|nr:hypothetical protein Nepgr_000847 [Nepenthes gracilis]
MAIEAEEERVLIIDGVEIRIDSSEKFRDAGTGISCILFPAVSSAEPPFSINVIWSYSKRPEIICFKWIIEDYYSAYSTLIMALEKLETASNAFLDRSIIAGHATFLQKSTTVTIISPSLHDPRGPLMQYMRYLRPQAAPLSHKASLTAAKNPFSVYRWLRPS